MPLPLSRTTVSTVLSYIIPPSKLLDPLPKYLVSPSLLQRHFVLDLNDPTADPAAYLSWPSSDQDGSLSIIDALETFTGSLEHLPLMLNVRYSGDVDSMFAHVEVPAETPDRTAVRVVFQWDADDSAWKYHNVALMPFPPQSFSSLTEFSIPTVQVEAGDGDSSYWDSYGGSDGPYRHSPKVSTHNESSEDAYWAQYSSVHGTADSTRPTPPPEPEQARQRQTSHDEENLHELNDFYGKEAHAALNGDKEETITIPYRSFNMKPPQDRTSPPCPDDLSDRLRALQSDTEPSSHSMEPDTSTTEITHLTNGFTHSDTPSDETESTGGEGINKTDAALRDAIRGTFALWKLSGTDTGRDQHSFLDLVKAAIADR